jgi:uncharacterized tellurite resistance protein B-like protein
MSVSVSLSPYLAARLAALGLKQDDDALDDAPPPPDEAALCVPACVFLEYETPDRVTARAVALRRVWEVGGDVAFVGFCHLRRALREFRAVKIVRLVDLSSGECPDDPAGWLRALGLVESSQDATRAVIATVRDELNILAHLAKADGRLHADEMEVMLHMVAEAAEVAPDPSKIDLVAAARSISRLAPDDDQLERSAMRATSDSARRARLERAMRRLIEADDEMPFEEQIAYVDLMRVIQSRRTAS